MITFTLDVESVGLHGEGFAVGWCIHNDGLETQFGVFACRPGLACGSEANREWIHANIPEIAPNLPDPRMVRAALWTAWKEAKNMAVIWNLPIIMLADCAWPVEARFLAQCVDDAPDVREWEGPYPLHDLGTYLLASGLDPTARYERTGNELPIHDPLADARQTARIFWDLRRGVYPVSAWDAEK